MAGGYMAILLCVFVSLIYLTSGTVDVHFLRHVPRLSNTSYWDTYFRCRTVGETLQWQVSNITLDRYQRQNVALVLTGNGLNFSYYATLLCANTISENEFSFDSVLIVTSLSNSSVNVACSNGSISANAVNEANEPGIEEATNTSSIFLEYLLTDDKDDSKHTSVFVCGVENNFMKLQINEDDDTSFLFSHFDNVGDERRLPQDIDTTVKQQAILIGKNAPYELATVMFVIHESPVTLSCGYNQISDSLTSRQLVTTMEAQLLTTSGIAELVTTSANTSKPRGSTIGSSAISETASTENTDGINLAAAVVLPIVIIMAAVLIIICLILGLIIFRVKKTSSEYVIQ